MREIWQDHFGNTIELHTLKTNTHNPFSPKELDSLKSKQFYFYGQSTEGFDFERNTYTAASIQMEKWGYRKVGVE